MKDSLLPPFTAFERGNTFYDIVTSYSIALAGLKSMFDPNNPMHFAPGEGIVIEGKVHSELTADIFELHRHAVTRHSSSPPVAQDLACMLITLAYERVKKQNDQSEAFEVLRPPGSSRSDSAMGRAAETSVT